MNRGWFQTEKPKEQRYWSFEIGQSAAEFAIIVPVLLLLLVAIADFGRVFFVSVAVNNAARAGAQYGSQSVITAADSIGMKAAAVKDALNVSNWNTPTASQCTCEVSAVVTHCAASYCTNAPSATYVEVDTSATFHTLLTYPGIPSSTTLSGKAVMQVQE